MGTIQRGKKGSERGSARRDLPQTLNEGEKDGWLLREMGQMAGTGNLLTLRDSKLFFWGSGRAEQADTQQPSPDDHFPLPPRAECQDGSCRSGKGHGGSGSHGAFVLLLITSAPPAIPSSSPTPEATSTIPWANPIRPQDPRTVAGQSGLPRKGRPQDAGSGAAVCEISWLLDMLSPRSVYTSP